MTYRYHDAIINTMHDLGYHDSEGMCYGIANMGMLSYLSGNIASFNDRVLKVRFSRVPGPGVKKSNQDISKKNKQPEHYSIDLMAFFDGIALFQSPEDYKHVFDINSAFSQNSRSAQDLVLPQDMSEDQRPVKLLDFSGVYSENELNTFLETIKKNLTAPASLLISSSNHTINLNFNPIDQRWTFIDANQLPAKTYNDTGKLLEEEKLLFYNKANSGHLVLTTALFTNKCFAFDVKYDFKEMQKTKNWQSIHEVTAKKLAVIDAFNNNWLRAAAEIGSAQKVEALIKQGAILDQKPDPKGVTGLIMAAQSGHADTVQKLLNYGAKVDAGHAKAHALFLAAQNGHTATVQKLLGKGANPEKRAKNGVTALNMAAQKGHADTVQKLLEYGADVDSEDANGVTALIMAAQNGDSDIVQNLLEYHADPKKRAKNGVTALILAAQNGHADILQKLIKFGDKVDSKDADGATVLIIAAENGQKACLRELINAKANLNQTDAEDRTPLHLAAENGHRECVRELINAQANLNQTDAEDRTPLHLAEKNGHTECVRELNRVALPNRWPKSRQTNQTPKRKRNESAGDCDTTIQPKPKKPVYAKQSDQPGPIAYLNLWNSGSKQTRSEENNKYLNS